jgi:hypothetical protein
LLTVELQIVGGFDKKVKLYEINRGASLFCIPCADSNSGGDSNGFDDVFHRIVMANSVWLDYEYLRGLALQMSEVEP